MAMEGLGKIVEKILSRAREEADGILAEAELDCANLRAEYSSRAEGIRKNISQEGEKEANLRLMRARASADVQLHNAISETRVRLLDEVFMACLLHLTSLEAEEYTVLLSGLLCAAVQELLETERMLSEEEDSMECVSYEVLLSVRDRERCGKKLLDECRRQMTGRIAPEVLENLHLADETVPIDAGLILRFGNIEWNASFERLFRKLREEAEAEVYQVLFGENRIDSSKGRISNDGFSI